MKNMLLTGAVLLFTSIATFANTGSKGERKEARELKKEKGSTIPYYQTEQQFLVDFPGATNVTWDTRANNKVTFTLNGKTMDAFYDWDNQLIGTVTDASYTDLPGSAAQFIEKHYQGYTPQTVLFFDDNQYNDTDMELFGSPFDDEDNYFVELKNDHKTIIVQVNMRGDVNFFKDMTNYNMRY
jgi:hypothetical protein